MNACIKAVQEVSMGTPMLLMLLGTHFYFTIRLRFIQKKIPQGIYMSFSKKGQGEGNISPFSALATSLAATIGTGNIIGISTAIAMGGPGGGFLVLGDRYFRNCYLLCRMLSFCKISCVPGRRYICGRADVCNGRSSATKKCSGGFCSNGGPCVFWDGQQCTGALDRVGNYRACTVVSRLCRRLSCFSVRCCDSGRGRADYEGVYLSCTFYESVFPGGLFFLDLEKP